MTMTPAMVADMTKLKAEGFSGSEIARHLSERHGVQVSRSAVINKARRLRIVKEKPAPPRKITGEAKPKKLERPPPPPRPLRKPPYDGHVGFAPGQSATVDILELEGRHCRWPIGHPRDPGFGFCGLPKDGDGSYCRFHARAAVAA